MQIIYLPDITPLIIIILAVALAWSLVWKGIALWVAAKKNHLAWFIVLLIVSTVGILEILYVYIFSKPQNKARKQEKRSARKTARRKRRR
ncbi:MAG TPA: DUF5652 family protein [Candidatus Nanoarchaeia archaeon]|nr:DUF5652 family protein [Candidatus Nanoarchaeia archaeon]